MAKPLSEYNAKRDFDVTAEPAGGIGNSVQRRDGAQTPPAIQPKAPTRDANGNRGD